jgi:acetyl esterase
MTTPTLPEFVPEVAARLDSLAGLVTWDDGGAEIKAAWEVPFGPEESWSLTEEGRVVAGPHGPVPVRVYTPRAAARGATGADGEGADLGVGDGSGADPSDALRPALVWCHGGGFMWGDLDQPEAYAVSRGVAGRADAVVVSVDYHLVDEPGPDGVAIPAVHNVDGTTGLHAPVPVDDVVAAVRWTLDHADELGIDPRRVALGGASAGGHLAAMATQQLATAARSDGGSDGASGDTGKRALAASLLMYPVAEATASTPTDEEAAALAATPMVLRWHAAKMEAMNENYLGRPLATASDQDFPDLIAARDLSAWPRTYVEVDEFDDLRVGARALADRLRAAGADVEYVVRRGVSHGHLNRIGLEAAHASMDHMAAIVREM